jgi:hypothetical protein
VPVIVHLGAEALNLFKDLPAEGMLFPYLSRVRAKVVRHSRKIVFQMAEVAVPRELFQTILERIGRLRSPTATG